MKDDQQKLGNYLILEKIAHGGMAEIFKAKTTDPTGIERLVVIKRILPHISSHPEYVEMLIDEAKIAVHFTHGNIAQIYDLGKVKDDYFIVMEYLDGKTLGQILREMKLRSEAIPLDIIAYCVMEVCHGLEYMHQKKDNNGKLLHVVHRDISPQNIIISYSGNVKIIDFGVAKAMDKLSQTESGVLKGKFAYMSPEQANGKEIDARSDIFSTGILLWELLTQKRLFKRKSNPETVKAVRKAHFEMPSKFRADIPKELSEICKKALSKRKRQRYQSAGEMARDLKRYLVTYNSNFRPVEVVQFLLKYFGPEPDETNLPAEMPQLEVAMKPRPEKTDKTHKENVKSESQIKRNDEQTQVNFLKNLIRDLKSNKKIVGLFLSSLAFIVFCYFTFLIVGWMNQATLVIHLKPKDAQLFIDNHYIQPQKKPVYEIKHESKVPLVIKATKEGFRPYEFTLVLKDNELKNLDIFLEKRIPPYGELSIITHPSGATVYVDEIQWTTLTPVKIPRLNAEKEYTIGLFLEGYQYQERQIIINSGEILRLDLELKPLDQNE